jgi:RimJ/RimL family protein N-acetyltransferase
VRGGIRTARLRLVPAGAEQVADLVAIHRDPWIAYERATGALVGRGGLSAMPAGRAASEQIGGLVGPAWAQRPLEVGWAIVAEYRGQGYATEIGRAGLEFAFDVLGADAVIAFTERHNTASRNVMERLGLRFAGEIASRGLVAGKSGEQDDAPFAVYSIGR